jgi:hypothetical protein
MRRIFAVVVPVLAVAACSGPPSDGKVTLIAPPRDTFPPVSDALSAHCGTLDCHGSFARNFRIYGAYGLRIGENSNSPEPTTPDEYEATYQSLVMLEPELISRVVRQGGAHPERLTVVRKARGAEHHEGGTQMPPGSPGDACLSTWFGPNLDTNACDIAKTITLPDQQ